MIDYRKAPGRRKGQVGVWRAAGCIAGCLLAISLPLAGSSSLSPSPLPRLCGRGGSRAPTAREGFFVFLPSPRSRAPTLREGFFVFLPSGPALRARGVGGEGLFSSTPRRLP